MIAEAERYAQMVNQSHQALVILHPSAEGSIADFIAAHVSVIHIASPRVLVVSGDSANLDRIARLPDVSCVLTNPEMPQEISSLDAKEALFVQGWVVAQQPKGRATTEGQPWDAPPFQPPDPPRK